MGLTQAEIDEQKAKRAAKEAEAASEQNDETDGFGLRKDGDDRRGGVDD